MWLLVILTTVLLIATVVVARNRWRAALWLGLGGIVAMVIARSLVHRVADEAPEIAATSGGRAAISAIVDGAATSLLRLAAVILIIAVVAAALAMFRRHWRRADVVLVGAVLTFVVIVAVLGVSIISLLLGVVVALLVPIGRRDAWHEPSRRRPRGDVASRNTAAPSPRTELCGSRSSALLAAAANSAAKRAVTARYKAIPAHHRASDLSRSNGTGRHAPTRSETDF